MSVLSYSSDALFTIRVVKSLLTNPDNAWVNNYEVQARVAGSEDELLAVATRIVAFEKAFHHVSVTFNRLLISTWAPDSKPYDPAAFISSTLTGNGIRSTGADPMALQSCFSVARVCASGRIGHLFYRGVLCEDDTYSPAGKSVLNNKALLQTALDTALGTSGFEDNIGAGADGALGLVMVGKTTAAVRTVIGLVAVGVAGVPNDHAWYNRSSSVHP